MSGYVHGGRGQEKQITGFVRILEGRDLDSWDFLWGELGAPVSLMTWEEVALWLEQLHVPQEAIDKQLKEQNTGEEIQTYVETSSSDNDAIQRVMTMFNLPRREALKVVMNTRLRERRHRLQGKPERTVNDVILEIINILQSMRAQGFGRYHGSHAFASKFAGNRGIDALLMHVRDGDNHTCFNALWALTLIGDSAEERPTENCESEAFARFEKRKLMIKAGGISIFINVLSKRPDESKELALHLLQALLVYPSHWIGWNGELMSQFFNSTSQVLLGGTLSILLDLLDRSKSLILRKLSLEIVQELMLADDAKAKRHCDVTLDSKFFRDPAPRSRANTASTDVSVGLLRTNMLTRMALEEAAKAQLQEEEKIATSSCPARDVVIEADGLAVLTRIISSPKVPGKLWLSNLRAKALPRADRLGDSDPYLRVFLEDQEQRTEVIMDTSRPVWEEALFFEVEDVAAASLIILVFDWNEYDAHKFMCMTRVHLAELVSDAIEGGSLQSVGSISDSELLSKITRSEHSVPIRNGDVVQLDDWMELRNRDGTPPTLHGVLGSLHCSVRLESTYRMNQEQLQLQADALGGMHILLCHPQIREHARREMLAPVLRLLQGPSTTAQANAASLLADMAMDLNHAHALMDIGGVEALMQTIDFGAMHTKLRATEAVATLAMEPSCRSRLINVKGHLGAGGDGIQPLVDLLGNDLIDEDVKVAAISVLCNLCFGSEELQTKVLQSSAPSNLIRSLHDLGCHAKAEATCLLALLAENPDNRRFLASCVGRSGERSVSTVQALSSTLSCRDSITDAKAKTGAADARAASVAALSFLSQYGGLQELVRVMDAGDQDVQTEAAAALAHIAAEAEQREAVVATGVVPTLVEMMILASSPQARLNSAMALARMSERGDDEKAWEVLERVKKVSAYVPRLGVNAIDPVVTLLLRSIHEEQRAVAAKALASWCMLKDNAEQTWTKGGELIIDLLMVDPNLNAEGMWYAVQTVLAIVEHASLREEVARAEYRSDGITRTTMGALRHVLWCEDKETVMEAALVLQITHKEGGLEELVDVLVKEDGSNAALKAVATVIQPLCSKPNTRKKIVALSGRSSDELSMWMCKYIYET